MKKKTKKRFIYAILTTISIVYFFYFQNNSLVTTKYTIHSEKIPGSFNNYKIVQLSDLHSKSFGKDQHNLVKRVLTLEPDLIVFTGDLVDSENYDEEISLRLMEKLVEVAPLYFVTGNHEWWSGQYDTLEEKLHHAGVQVLRNQAVEIYSEKEKIHLIGIDDSANPSYTTMEENIKTSIQGLKDDENYKILLSHRPELLSLYSNFEFDLVFSGHAHGGQFRIPFIGGLIAPNQGFFPEFDSGIYSEDQTTMIVNRGLGNSVIPLRLFNRPEIVVVTLENE